MLLSVIIPVYNCAPVVVRCLESIDYVDAEIIVIDDGSQDESSQQVQKYASTHPNVKLVRKNNEGVSSARNIGIEHSTGKYLMFVDADDYLAPGGIERLLSLAEENDADVVKYRIVSRVINDEKIETSVYDFPLSIEIIRGEGAALKRTDISDYHVVDALFKRAIIQNHNIKFHTDLSLREDDVFMGELFCHTRTIIKTNLPLYQYIRSSPFSSTHNQDLKKQRKLIESGYLAVRYRYNYVKRFFPSTLSLERLKYMRWVPDPLVVFKAGYTLKEYNQLLEHFSYYDCWPLDYQWIHVSGLDFSTKRKVKMIVRTFLCNHPQLSYIYYSIRKTLSKQYCAII